MTTAPQLAVGTTLVAADDAWFSVFQSTNNPGSTILLAGNFFLGLQAYTVVRVDMGSLLGLARGATIEPALTPAALTFTAAGSWTAGGTISVNCMLDDSPRKGPLDTRLAWKPDGGITNNWRRDFWGVFDIRIEDTGGTPFLDQGLGTSGTFAFLPVAGLRQKMAARFTVPAGPDWSVARVLCEMRRFNSPTGAMELAIQGDSTNAVGVVEPDGVDLGVSTPVLNSTIVSTPGSGPVTHAFSSNVLLAPGTYWVVMRGNPEYVADFTNFVVWMQKRQFLGVGGSHFHSTFPGSRFDQANYPGHVDVHFDTLAKEVGTPIIWNPIARVSGQSVSTPDLSPLVQEVIRRSGHETTSALCFTFRTVGETRTYRFAANDHPTLAPPGFAAQFRRRDTRARRIPYFVQASPDANAGNVVDVGDVGNLVGLPGANRIDVVDLGNQLDVGGDGNTIEIEE